MIINLTHIKHKFYLYEEEYFFKDNIIISLGSETFDKCFEINPNWNEIPSLIEIPYYVLPDFIKKRYKELQDDKEEKGYYDLS